MLISSHILFNKDFTEYMYAIYDFVNRLTMFKLIDGLSFLFNPIKYSRINR